tara:strand:- start:100 stop:279 length:180 start_codon:yes stop_codon:yes gene_type:complete
MKKEKKISSVYYDNDFDKISKLTERFDIMEMELKAERQIRKKAEKHIEELVKIIKDEIK